MVGIAAGAQQANVPEWRRVRLLVSEAGENASKLKANAVRKLRVQIAKDLRKQRNEGSGAGWIRCRAAVRID
jgi:hypothetical protein